MFSDRSVVGLYDRRGFQLRMNISYRNSFQTVLYGSMRASGMTTRITCTARVGTFVAAFMAIWFAAVLLMGGGVAVSVVAKIVAGAPLVQNLPGIAIFALMLLFGVGLVYSGRLWARDDEQKLIAFLEDTIDVTPL